MELDAEEWEPDPLERGRERLQEATPASDRADCDEAERLFEEAERILRDVDDSAYADVIYQHGYLDLERGDPAAALDRFEEARRIYREVGSATRREHRCRSRTRSATSGTSTRRSRRTAGPVPSTVHTGCAGMRWTAT